MFPVHSRFLNPLMTLALVAPLSAVAQTIPPESPALLPLAQVTSAPSEPEPESKPPAAESPAASDDEWKVRVTPFAWLPKTRLNVSYGDRSVNREITPSQAISNLQFAIAGQVAAQNGRWGVTGEGLYANLADDVQYRNITGSLRSNETLLQASGSYRLVDDDGFTLDGVVGLRFYDFGFTNSFTRDGVIFTRNFDAHRSRSWVDPLIGLRSTIPFNKELNLNLYGDVGGFGVGSDLSWRAQAVFGYNVSDSVSLNLGYSALGARYQQGAGSNLFKIDFTNYGPVVGATIKL